MIEFERRVRLLGLTLACATLASALGGCGGGGGGGSPPPPPPPPATESTYLLAEFVAGDSNNQFVRVWDPARPAVAIQNVRLVQTNGIVWTSSHLVFSDATTYDATTRSVTTLGHAKAYFDNGGHLWSIDLRGGRSHVPVQLSSAADAFLPTDVVALDGTGVDAWVDVQGGSHHWAIRSTMTATDAPMDVLKILAPMRDAATGRPQFFFVSLGGQSGTAVRATTFEIVDAAFAPLPIAAVAAMGSGDAWIGADAAQSGLGYVRIGNQLRALHWGTTPASVVVDTPSLYAFTYQGLSIAPSTADAQRLYFNDGMSVLSMGNGALRTVGQLSSIPSSLTDAGGYVAAVEPGGIVGTQSRYQLETLRKSDGALTRLEDATSTLRLLAASDQGLVITGTAEQGQAVVLASGDNTSRTTLGAQSVGVVRAATARIDQPAAPLAVLSCVAGATGLCGSGALTQLGLAGGAITTLGTLDAGAPWVRGDAIAGLVTSLMGQSLLTTAGGLRRRRDRSPRRVAIHARHGRDAGARHEQPALTRRARARRGRAGRLTPRSVRVVRAGRRARRSSRMRSRSRRTRRGASS